MAGLFRNKDDSSGNCQENFDFDFEFTFKYEKDNLSASTY